MIKLIFLSTLFVIQFHGFLSAAVPKDQNQVRTFNIPGKPPVTLNPSDTLEALIELLINTQTTGNEGTGRQGRKLLGPGVWCNLPTSLVNALQVNVRSPRFLGILGLCTPPQWKTQWKVTKGFIKPTTTTPCPVTSGPGGPCLSPPSTVTP